MKTARRVMKKVVILVKKEAVSDQEEDGSKSEAEAVEFFGLSTATRQERRTKERREQVCVKDEERSEGDGSETDAAALAAQEKRGKKECETTTAERAEHVRVKAEVQRGEPSDVEPEAQNEELLCPGRKEKKTRNESEPVGGRGRKRTRPAAEASSVGNEKIQEESRSGTARSHGQG